MSRGKQRVQDAFEKFIEFKAPRYSPAALHQADYDAFLIEAYMLASSSNARSSLRVDHPPTDLDYPGVYAMCDRLALVPSIAYEWAREVTLLPVTT